MLARILDPRFDINVVLDSDAIRGENGVHIPVLPSSEPTSATRNDRRGRARPLDSFLAEKENAGLTIPNDYIHSFNQRTVYGDLNVDPLIL